ncbi:MAG: beta-lactamase family protein [Betaproteobacteria bacterium]|nr:beta-lactamase family protein [Betaproteobacteria bacterium]
MKRLTAASLSLGFAILLTGCSSAPPNALPVARDDIDGVQSQMESYIQHEMARFKLAGLSIALVDDQEIIWARGFGWADVEARIQTGPDTRYRVGSISKLFTDTAAMQLVAEGRLDLDAPVQNTLPWFSIGSAWHDAKPITLRQLMSHHSGLPRDTAGGMWMREAPSSQHDFHAMLRALAETQADAPPERIYSYSNVAIDVVGAMVEAASGQPFEQHIQESLLAPLGMQGAQFSAAMPTDDTMARGHFRRKNQDEPAFRDVPAGGLNASVTDLARFLMMQFSGGRNREGAVVLTATQQAAMLQHQYPGLPLDADMRVGLGWHFTTLGTDAGRGGDPVAYHAGGMWNFHSQMMIMPEQKLGVIVLSNDRAARGVVDSVARRALDLLLEARSGIRPTPEPGFAPATQAWTDAQWQSARTACAGDYMTPFGFASIKPKGLKLRARYYDRWFEMREGEMGRLGLRYRLAGIFPIELGTLSEIGFECTLIDGRPVLLSVFDGKRMLIGEKLPEPSLPTNVSNWIGRYKPRLLEGESADIDLDIGVRIFQADGRLWVEYRTHSEEDVRMLLQPVSETAVRVVSGPLTDTGSVVQLENEKDEASRFRFSGWIFDRVAE